jgi:acetylornithine deacetylase
LASKGESVKDIGWLLSRWIGINSVCEGSNLRFTNEVQTCLKMAGFRTLRQRRRVKNQDFYNVLGFKGPKNGRRPLLICSHLDTVPSGNPTLWTKTGGNPWKAAVKGGVCYGLGSADDKGPLLAMLMAGASIKESDLKRPLIVLATYGEENGMGGAATFVKSWKKRPYLKPAYVIAGEPTELGVTYRHKGVGVLQIEITVPSLKKITPTHRIHIKGKSGHSSRPSSGENALDKAMAYLKKDPECLEGVCLFEGGSAANIIPGECVIGFHQKKKSNYPIQTILDCYSVIQEVIKPLKRKKDFLISPRTLTSNFGSVSISGKKIKLLFDFRLLSGQSIERIRISIMKRFLDKVKSQKGVRVKMHIERNNSPLGLKKTHPLVHISKRAIQRAGIKPHLLTKPACTEAGMYQSNGVPAVVIGPGKAYGNIHAPNESIRLSQIKEASVIYREIIKDICMK